MAWTPELRAAVERAKALTGKITPLSLFYKAHNRPPSYETVRQWWKTACALAGVSGANLHDLRKLSAGETWRQSGSKEKAQALLAHGSAAMTERYLLDKEVTVVTGPSIGHLIDRKAKT